MPHLVVSSLEAAAMESTKHETVAKSERLIAASKLLIRELDEAIDKEAAPMEIHFDPLAERPEGESEDIPPPRRTCK